MVQLPSDLTLWQAQESHSLLTDSKMPLHADAWNVGLFPLPGSDTRISMSVRGSYKAQLEAIGKYDDV